MRAMHLGHHALAAAALLLGFAAADAAAVADAPPPPVADSACSGRPTAGGAPLVDAALRDAALDWLQRLVVRAPGQAADGAVRNHPGSGHVDPAGRIWQPVSAYAVNLGLTGALAVSPAVLPTAAGWLRWMARHVARSGPDAGVVHDHWLRADNFAETTCPPGLAARRCHEVDAVDSTAASTLLVAEAYLRHGGDAALLREPPQRALLEDAAAALRALSDGDGLTLARRSHPLVYTMDTAEVIAGWRAWARLQRSVYAEPASALLSEAAADRARAGLRAVLWDGTASAWRVHRGDAPQPQRRWYPDTVAQAWPLLWGADADPGPWRRAQRHWQPPQRPHWARQNPDPTGFWWPAAAVAALCTGDAGSARTAITQARARWLDPHAPLGAFPWPFQISDLLWLSWLADPVRPRDAGADRPSPPSPFATPVSGEGR